MYAFRCCIMYCLSSHRKHYSLSCFGKWQNYKNMEKRFINYKVLCHLCCVFHCYQFITHIVKMYHYFQKIKVFNYLFCLWFLFFFNLLIYKLKKIHINSTHLKSCRFYLTAITNSSKHSLYYILSKMFLI